MHVALVGAEFEENLAVRYLWGALEAAGHRVTQVVFNRSADLERAARAIADSGAELAGLSMVFTARGREFAELARRARELGFGGHLVAGGHFAGFYAEQLLRDVPALDSVALGEGENILCALVGKLDELGAVEGLVWRRRADGQIVRNHAAPKPPDLDVLPWPPRKSPLDDYLGIPVTNILSSRGCAHSCAFCSIAAWHKLCGGARVRMRSVERVADEMAALHQRGVRIFNFHDDNFLPPSRAERLARVAELGRAIEARRLGRIAFAIKARPDALDEELLRQLVGLGLFRLFLGIEAGTPESLRALGRRQHVEDNVRALELVNRLGIHCCFNLLMLNPDSTLEDLAGNVRFLREQPRNPMNFCRTEIYAGTPLELRLRAEGRLRGDYWGYDYRIADEPAQAAFELIFPCFEQRNFGEHGLHHLCMQVDYEHQLRAHFFGLHTELACQVKRYVVRVNLNTAAHLEALVAEIARRLPDERTRSALVAEHRASIDADGERLAREGHALLEAIHAELAPPRQPRRPWARKAAVGLAASIAVAAACHKEQNTQIAEMAPGPTGWGQPGPEQYPPEDAGPSEVLVIIPELDAGETHPTEMVAPPPPPPPPNDAGVSPAGLLPPELRQQALFIISRYVPPQDMELELWFDGGGTINRVVLRVTKVDRNVVRNAGQEIGGLSTSDPDVRGRHFVLKFTARELRDAAAASSHTYESEMAPMPPPPPPPPPTTPRPRPRPPEHYNEMAARPHVVSPGTDTDPAGGKGGEGKD
jgi:anaerobic magnesium-protoporphyrin IX monomethyl ester cyclase